MQTREIIAWAIIVLLVVAVAVGTWLAMTARRRQRRRENRSFDRHAADRADAEEDAG